MRMRYGRYLAGLLVLGIALLFSIQSEAAAKKTIYNSPYVSFSPDGRAFTTCAGDRNYVWYARDDSTTVYTQIPSSLRDPVVGEHIFIQRNGMEKSLWDIGKWSTGRDSVFIMDIPEKNGTGYLLADKNACSIIIPAGKPIVRIVEKPLKSTISI